MLCLKQLSFPHFIILAEGIAKNLFGSFPVVGKQNDWSFCSTTLKYILRLHKSVEKPKEEKIHKKFYV